MNCQEVKTLSAEELNRIIVDDDYYSDHKILEHIFSIPAHKVSNETLKSFGLPEDIPLSPTILGQSGILTHLVSCGLEYTIDERSIMTFDIERVREFFKRNDIALPQKLFPDSYLNTEKMQIELTKSNLLEKHLARKNQDNQEQKHKYAELDQELKRLQIEKLQRDSHQATIDLKWSPPVALEQETSAVEARAQNMPNQTASTRDELKELCRRMRNEGKTDIAIAVALWPDDSDAWVNGKDRLDKESWKKERNRLEKKVARLLPRAD